jgi:hypothetical protein
VQNNQPTIIPVPETALTQKPLFVVIKIDRDASSPAVAIYKTKLRLAHLGRTWICNGGDLSKGLRENNCTGQENGASEKLGIGMELRRIPSLSR